MRKASLMLILTPLVLVTLANLVRAQPTTLYVDPTPVTATVCSEFTVAVNVMDIMNLYVYEFRLSFDPNLVECLSGAEGPFLALSGPTLWLPPIIDNTAGFIHAACTILGPSPGSSGSGTLAYVTFHCKGAGACDLTFMYPETYLLDPSMIPIPHVSVNGHVVQTVSLPVGGEWVPVDKLDLLTPWISLASIVAVAVSFACVRRVKKRLN